MAIPMTVGDEVIGVLDVQSDEREHFTDQDVQIQTTLALQVAIAINNARLFAESQQRLAIIENSDDMIGLLDMDGIIAYMNSAGVKMLGLESSSDLIGKPITDVIQITEDEDSTELMESVLGGGLWHDETEIPRMDGTTIPVEQSVFAIRDEEDEPQFLALIMSDITERKQSQAELDNQRRIMEAVLENLPVGVFMAEAPSGNALLSNKAAQDMLGRGIAPDIGADELAEVYEAFQADTDEPYPAEQMPLVRGMFGESARVDDMEIHRPDGSRILLEVTGAPITDAAGNITSSVAVFQDITERREAQAQIEKRATEMETVAEVGAEASASLEIEKLLWNVSELTKERFDLYHVHVYLLNPAGDVLELAAGSGDAGKRMVEAGHRIRVDSPASLVARSVRDRTTVVVNNVVDEPGFLPNPLLPATRSEMAIPMIVGNKVIGVLDVQSSELNRYDDQDVRVQSTLASQVAVAVNNAQLYAEQVEAAEQLREVDRLKSEFLASMSHELRTPLNSIIGYAEVLLDGIDGELTDEMEEDIDAIHGSGKHLLNLINDILDLAKIEAGQMDLVREDLELGEFIQDIINTSRVLLKGKPVELKLDIQADLPLVDADSLRLRQVISNLTTNAIKFTEEGSITISAHQYEPDPSMVLIAVKDTGVGITEENLPLIFERFRQVDQSHTRRVGGTGLGLSITRQLIQMHGGDIWVESEFSSGSSFYFTVPVAEQEDGS
jgi:PAS domain S-box-containing protein